MPSKRKIYGYLLGALAAASYGTNPLFAMPCYADGMDANSVLLFRYALSLPIIALMIVLRGRDFRIKRGDIVPLVVLALMMTLSSLTLYKSYNYMDVGIASTILFVYPVLVTVIMGVFFKEKASPLTILCIAMSLAGIFLLYKAKDGSTLSLTGTLIVLVSAITYALYIVGVNKTRINDMPTVKLTFWVLAFSTVMYALNSAFSGGVILPKNPSVWLDLAGVAVFPTLVSFLCTTQSIHVIGSTPTAILGALEPVTAIIIGVFVFGETLTPRNLLGISLVLVSVILIIAGGTLGGHLLRIRRLFPRLPRRSRLK